MSLSKEYVMKIVMLIALIASIVHGFRAIALTGTKWVNADPLERWYLSLSSPEDYIAIVACPLVFLTLQFIPSGILIPFALLAYSVYGIYRSY
jgi:hypothetical protein